MAKPKSAFILALKVTSPIFLSNIPQGMLFGFMFMQFGYPWFFAPLMSLFVFSGMVQFMALTLVLAGVPVYQIATTALMMSTRNSFYGFSFLERYRCRFWKKCYLVFSMVDSTYAILASRPKDPGIDDTDFCMWVSFLIHFYFVLGTFLGAFFLPENVAIPGLHFVVTALFTVMTLEQYFNLRSFDPFCIGVLAALIASTICPQHGLFVTILLSAAILYWVSVPNERLAIDN